MTLSNMNANEFLKAIDHAAMMNDRWLFLAAFCLLLLVCAVIIYWLVKHLQTVVSQNSRVGDAHTAALEKIINTQNEMAIKLAICIDRNSAALQECSFELRRFQEQKNT